MTRDELLDKIEAIDYWQEQFANKTFLKALQAVVELHKPYTYTNYKKQELLFCSVCEIGNVPDSCPYPCPTIEAIEKVLR